MKLKEGFVLRCIAGECVVVDVNSDLRLDGMLALNSTAQTLWRALEQGECDEDALGKALTDEYEVDEATARRAVCYFVDKLKELNLLA